MNRSTCIFIVTSTEIAEDCRPKVGTYKNIAGYALRTRRFELFAYFFGEAAGLAASFLAPLPAFTSTSAADML
jgi:hypothetical protein